MRLPASREQCLIPLSITKEAPVPGVEWIREKSCRRSACGTISRREYDRGEEQWNR